jgi:hypothetical protein
MQMSVLTLLWVLWGIVTTALAGVVIYRSLVGMREEDRLFLDAGEANLQAEQVAVVSRLDRLTPYIKLLAGTSAVLLLAIAGVWIYRGLAGFSNPALP